MRRDRLIALGLFLLPAFFFAPVIFGGQVLVPFDNLFRFPPWSAFANQFGIAIPHNELISDLVLENYAWKKFIVESLRAGEIPLWNPYLFAGVPFLAAGQHSALYPFSLLFYILPIARAFGYFVALQLALAALNAYVLTRVLGLNRLASAVSGIVYAFSGFMVVSTTFPMVIATAAWLPAILACIELVLRSREAQRRVFFALVGAILLGIQFLAGHAEFSIYILIIGGFFTLWRAATLLLHWRRADKPTGNSAALEAQRLGTRLSLLAAMVIVGVAIASVQLIPLYELVQHNFRSGSVSFQDVVGWAYPKYQVIAFLMPDFFGNPTHHSYLDVFDLTNHPAPAGTIFWGKENYVEAGSYVGILPLVLAAIAVVAGLQSLIARRRSASGAREAQAEWPYEWATWLFAALALLSLLFIFGTPLYGLLFYLVPGFNQLHTPFRWVFPYTLSMSVLAGIGIEVLSRRPAFSTKAGLWGWLLVSLGGAGLAGLVLTWIGRAPILALADRVVASVGRVSAAFDSGRMLYSYEFRNILIFACALIGAGTVIRLSQSSRSLPARLGGLPVWQPLALIVVVADLFIIGMPFYSATDARLAEFTPPAVKFLQQDPSLFRITSYDQRGDAGEKVFNPNSGMLFGLADIRGYDSIIPKQYAELMGLLAPQDELLANRIAAFYGPDPLSSPLVNLLNVKYVLTKRPLPNAGYTLVYDDEIKIYRNDRVLARAFMVPNARVLPDRAALLAEMKRFDPTREVLLDQEPGTTAQEVRASCDYAPVSVDRYAGSEAIFTSNQTCSGWLVLSDSYFSGWIAQLDGQDTALYRADYNFRAVYVPAGEHKVRFKYSPISFRAGIIGSFLGAMLLLLGFAYLAWQRFYRPGEDSEVRVVAKNSLLPMATSLLMKLLDFAFTIFSLRVLGPTGTGRYAWAVGLWLFASTITDFGLGILLTREVSRDRSQANRYLTNATILRVALWLVSLIPFGLIAWAFVAFSDPTDITRDAALTFGLLMFGLLPSSVSASLAFLFNAYERFEYRVAVDVLTRIISISLGVVVLLLGYGYVGLGTASILTNLFTLAAFYFLVRTTLFVPRWQPDRGLIRWMIFESYPLMFNNLLSSLFFRIDALILPLFKGVDVLGYYNTAYKFIDALNFIPSNFTLAIFPTLNRLAVSSKDAMLRAYLLSLKLLLWISLPITVGTMFIAHELIDLTGGSAYLPHSAIALQVLIWFLPFSFINSVTHYVLIALGQQRFLTKAFVIGVVFNIVANLIAIQPLSYVGAALVTILSEIVLLIPFYYCVRKNLASIPFWSLMWRPALAAGLMGIALWGMMPRVGLLIAVPVAGLLYVVLLVLSGALGEDERALLRRLLPQRLHRVARVAE